MTTRLHLSTLALFAALPLGGCYTYAVTGADKPAPGTAVAVILNDRGRAELDEQLGPEVWQVEGTVVSTDDSSLSLSMARTSTLEHQDMRWAGETVRLRSDYCRTVMVRQFSVSRTAIAAGTATAGVIALLTTTALLGGGSGQSGPNSQGGTGAQ